MTKTGRDSRNWLSVAFAAVIMLCSCSDKEVPTDEVSINQHVVEGIYQGQWTADGEVISTVDLTVTGAGISFSQLPVEYLTQLVREANNGAPAANQPVASIEKGTYYCYYHEGKDQFTGERKNYFMEIVSTTLSHLIIDIAINGNPCRMDVAMVYPPAGLLNEEGTLILPLNMLYITISDYQTTESYGYRPDGSEVMPELKLECNNIKMK